MRRLLLVSLLALSIGCTEQDGATTEGPVPDGSVMTADGVPLEASALHTYLRGGTYRQWVGESQLHPSTGPHGGRVRTYLSPGLLASLTSSSAHPKDAVAIKELYGSGTTVTGWAVGAKLQADSSNGAGWYWYEVFSVQPGAQPAFSGRGLALCSNCHSSGRDYVLTPFPLQ